MKPDLRTHFDAAVSADPGADPGEMARAAMLHGGRIRHRRRLAVAGLAAGMAAVVGAVGLAVGAASLGEPPVTTIAAAMRMPAPDCSEKPVTADATDVAIFLSDATDQQKSALGRALNGDQRVASLIFESREQAYARFAILWRDSPDFVAAVSPKSLPESYRLRLRDPAHFAAFSQEYEGKPGVADIVGRVCRDSAPVGGVR